MESGPLPSAFFFKKKLSTKKIESKLYLFQKISMKQFVRVFFHVRCRTTNIFADVCLFQQQLTEKKVSLKKYFCDQMVSGAC